MKKNDAVTGGTQAERFSAFLLVVIMPLLFTPFTTAPVVDGKLVAVALAALCLALTRPVVDRPLAYAAVGWVAILCLASLMGLDPWWSVLGQENQSAGVVLLGSSALILCAATGISQATVEKIPRWFFRTCTGIAIGVVINRFIPGDEPSWFVTGLMGHRVFAGGVLGAGIIVALGLKRSPWVIAATAIIASGLAVTAARSSWIGAALGAVYVFARQPREWRSILTVVVPVLLVLAGWTVADRALPEAGTGIPYSAVPRFAELSEGSAQERIHVWRANLGAWVRNPVLGSGPATGWHGYLSEATGAEVRVAGRNYGDAHNVVVELLATTGALGVVALLGLFAITAHRMVLAPHQRAWAGGAAIVIGFVHLFQPLNVRLTPLLFLFAGLSAGPASATRRLRLPRWVALAAAVALLFATARFSASAFEQYGSMYDSKAALRTAVTIEPRRRSATIELAEVFGFYRLDERDVRRALELAELAVKEHPWNPAVRLQAAEAVAAIGDNGKAARLIDEHLERFPNDALAWAGAASLALRRGDRDAATRYAMRALEIDPEIRTAKDVLASLRERER